MAVGSVNASGSQSYPAYKSASAAGNGNELTEDQKKEVSELKKRDLEVRAHEAAHIAAGGAYIKGGASFSYQSGPDGKRYAIGGEVSIDTSAVKGDPDATIQKMETVKRAAMAPSNPSGQDNAVAAAASATQTEAVQEKNGQSAGGQSGGKSADDKNSAPPVFLGKSNPKESGRLKGYSKGSSNSRNVNIYA